MEQVDGYRVAKIVAVVAGLLARCWRSPRRSFPSSRPPRQLAPERVLDSVTAPLISYVATDLDISIPCSAALGLTGPGKTVLLSTVPQVKRPRPSTAAC